WAVDYYATREALRNVREAEAKAPRERVVPRLLRVNDVLDRHSSSLPAQALRTIKAEVKAAVAAAQTQDELVAGQVSLVAPLATAGITAVAYEHETAKQLIALEEIADRLEQRVKGTYSPSDLLEMARDLRR